MADEITVEVKGLDELQTNLEKLSDKAGTDTVRAAVRAGATIIRNAMVLLAPKQSGLLAEHFDIRTKKQSGTPLAVSALVGPNAKTVIHKQEKGKTAGLPRTALFITRLLEFGGVRQAKKPFMTQAWESYKSEAFDAMVDTLKKRRFLVMELRALWRLFAALIRRRYFRGPDFVGFSAAEADALLKAATEEGWRPLAVKILEGHE